jgi:hypothetical protein
MTTDLYQFLTGGYKMKIAKAIQDGEPLDYIKELVLRAKSRLSFSDLLGKPAFDPNAQIPQDTNNIEVFKSMLPFSEAYTKMTTPYDVCIKSYSTDPEYYKKIFELFLKQRQPKTNFAELVVKLVDYAISNPEFDCGLLDVMKEHKHKINLNHNVFVPKEVLKSLERSDLNNNNVSNPSVSSSSSQKSGLLSLFDRFDALYSQQPIQQNDIMMPLGKFLNLVSKASGNEKIAAFTEAIRPSQTVDDPSLTPTKKVTFIGK